MPTLISIAVESPKLYMAIDSESRVWRGQAARKRGASIVIKSEPVKSEFMNGGAPARLRGGSPQRDAVEDEPEPPTAIVATVRKKARACASPT